mgnify:CR=1 FL=1
MQIGVMKIKLYAPWVHSLKEKRMVVKSIVTKIKNKFNVSAVEADEQDTHQTIVIAMCSVFTNGMQPDSVWNNIINFIEDNTEAEITDVYREIR